MLRVFNFLFLSKTGKAPVTAVKKITSGTTNGAVVQLGRPVRVLGIAEGVETALAAGEWFHMPVWAAIGAENLANFEAVPESVMRLVIFGDNDRNFVGQEAAYPVFDRKNHKETIEKALLARLSEGFYFLRSYGVVYMCSLRSSRFQFECLQ